MERLLIVVVALQRQLTDYRRRRRRRSIKLCNTTNYGQRGYGMGIRYKNNSMMVN